MTKKYLRKLIFAWAVLLISLLLLIWGLFTLADDFMFGIGLTLLGIGALVPMVWWTRRSQSGKQTPRFKAMSAAGGVFMIAGAVTIVYPLTTTDVSMGEDDIIQADEVDARSANESSEPTTVLNNTATTRVSEADSGTASLGAMKRYGTVVRTSEPVAPTASSITSTTISSATPEPVPTPSEPTTSQPANPGGQGLPDGGAHVLPTQEPSATPEPSETEETTAEEGTPGEGGEGEQTTPETTTGTTTSPTPYGLEGLVPGLLENSPFDPSMPN
ncbi:hypothetical protein COCCU_12910 [Corynebacterium occultum]|uniref:Uncharacterized protein n=1 Tax=Corynebacterium occultum TaxID=2675219 RepID=A0A6B8W758_9CORY|nr:hypothetical protein [Corynebacterium occultum]QGU08481.1 hypothetical protein COCCU_12910 [Corynebacterium occultum]